MFGYITKHRAQTIILDYKLKPFIPDYIPAVGDIDAFLKVRDDFLYSVKMKNVNRNISCVQVDRPRVDVECGGHVIQVGIQISCHSIPFQRCIS